MTLSLNDIESAIRRNFVLDESGGKLLESNADWEANSTQTARVIFVGIALEQGYHVDDVCAYLGISGKRCLRNAVRYRELIKAGKYKLAELKRGGMPLHLVLDKTEMADSLDIRIYRKSILVNNCLGLMLKAKLFEFRQTLPYYVG